MILFKRKIEILCVFDLGSKLEDVVNISNVTFKRDRHNSATYRLYPSELLMAKGIGSLIFGFTKDGLLAVKSGKCDKKIKLKF